MKIVDGIQGLKTQNQVRLPHTSMLLPSSGCLKHSLRVTAALAVTASLVGQSVRINEFSAYPGAVPDSPGAGGTDWRMKAFDDRNWPQATLPIGMDQGSNYTLSANLVGEMRDTASSLYLRLIIEVPAELAESTEPVALFVDYDDAFVLYLNGIEVSRGNIGAVGTPPAYDAFADGNHPASNDGGAGVDRTEQRQLGRARDLFREGTNAIAVQLHNHSLTSSDAYLQLRIEVGTTRVATGGAQWRYFVGTREPDESGGVASAESDWIELFNASSADVNLEGWSLTDDTDDLRQWVFPDLMIPAKGYLVVLASGEDKRDPGGRLETSFKLSSSGEYLALADASGNPVSEFFPTYPEQAEETSFGWDEDGQMYQVFTTMTPGWPNGSASFEGIVEDTAFSVDRGFYDEPFSVEISTLTEGAQVRYTTDGSTPTESTGQLYAGPIRITTTTVLRTIAFKEGYLSTNVDTQTYIFLADVIHQGNKPSGFPDTWKNVDGEPDLPADYEMDPEVTEDPLYRDQMRGALLSIPTISLVTDIKHFFDRSTGIYMNPGNTGMAWERPVSVEWIYPDGRESFQIDAGVRVQGGHTRDPRKTPKRSLRLAFRSEYGGNLKERIFPEPDAADEFDTIILRGGANQSWLHHNEFRGDNRRRAQYVRDQFAKDMQGKMGAPHLHNGHAFVYINGLFWGLYNPTERATNEFGEAYLGGDEEDFDALNSGELLDGTMDRWNQLMALIDSDVSNPTQYAKVAELLDLERFTDYMLLNHWGGNEDWDHHNWYALGNRLGGKFHFFTWDSEFFFETGFSNVTNKRTDNCPGEIWHSLLRNSDYRMLVADRLHKHVYNNGALTTSEALKLWEERSAQVYLPLIAESARWGDYRRDVHRRAGPYELYTRDNQWQTERKRLLKSVIPLRPDLTKDQYSRLGLVPSTPPPVFSRERGVLTDAKPLAMSVQGTDNPVIYFTVDGSDPRLPGGAVSPTARIYQIPLTVSKRTRIQARTLIGSVWSPLQSGDFHPAGDPADLQISELLYAPLPMAPYAGKDLEFIEILNAGPAAVSLDGLVLEGGIQFKFPAGVSLDPHGRVVVVSNLTAFRARHPAAPVAGEYNGNLSNSGEPVRLRHADLGFIQELVYSNWYPWPATAGQNGYSLIPVSLHRRGLPTQSTAWKSSPQPGGSPGIAEVEMAQWFNLPPFGWVYSDVGATDPGTWLYGTIGFFYLGSYDTSGSWFWTYR